MTKHKLSGGKKPSRSEFVTSNGRAYGRPPAALPHLSTQAPVSFGTARLRSVLQLKPSDSLVR